MTETANFNHIPGLRLIGGNIVHEHPPRLVLDKKSAIPILLRHGNYPFYLDRNAAQRFLARKSQHIRSSSEGSLSALDRGQTQLAKERQSHADHRDMAG